MSENHNFVDRSYVLEATVVSDAVMVESVTTKSKGSVEGELPWFRDLGLSGQRSL